jgi:hypothetical protein
MFTCLSLRKSLLTTRERPLHTVAHLRCHIKAGDRQNVYLQSRTNAETFCLVTSFCPKLPSAAVSHFRGPLQTGPPLPPKITR